MDGPNLTNKQARNILKVIYIAITKEEYFKHAFNIHCKLSEVHLSKILSSNCNRSKKTYLGVCDLSLGLKLFKIWTLKLLKKDECKQGCIYWYFLIRYRLQISPVKSITILYSTWNHLKTIAFPMISALMEINLFTSIRSSKIWWRSLNELWIMVWWRARFSFNAMASCFSAVSVMISCIILGVLLLWLQYPFISLHQNKKPSVHFIIKNILENECTAPIGCLTIIF